jgi:amidase
MHKFSWCLTGVLLIVGGRSTAQEPSRTIALDEASVADLNAAFNTGSLTSEQLVRAFLTRINTYDKQGPTLRALITLNPKAVEVARSLDAERKARGARSPLHGIPVILKDNIDTGDMPTTAGSIMLAGSVPPDDAFFVKRLRDAGAIILGKANLSEFASGRAGSSLGGQMRNPHDLARTPLGSSGGSAIAVAAAYAVVAVGTDTGGSIRLPSSTTGIVGLKPTHGLVSCDGVIPLAPTLDTAGPMARSVYDVAAALSVMAGVDPNDSATKKSVGHIKRDYTTFLRVDALKATRIGIARDFMGYDPDVDWTTEAALAAIRRMGGTVVDVQLPKWLLDSKGEFYNAIRYPEFAAYIPAYLKTLGAAYPKNIEELITKATEVNAPGREGAGPNPNRWTMMKREAASGKLDDYRYTSVRDHALVMVRAVIDGVLKSQNLDAIFYPTQPRRAPLLTASPDAPGGLRESPVNLANLTGFPDLTVPAGFTSDGLPVTVSFLGPAFSEPRLLAIGYSFEQATHARRLPVNTPRGAGEGIRLK